ncbi:PD-(D/E)XK nuclease-like domain-containing protein [Companilactobacillus musae]|uniref:PD-(D/E)XK nuclease-like domain-containing protein n=1 Tax=Companilactobacillus musae TaxID=1903258 RepID=UPI0034184F6B
MLKQMDQSQLKKTQIKQNSLTQNNYYDLSTDISWQSPTFFKKFLACEAETMAELNKEYKPDFKEALLVGNYLHTYFESPEAHLKFVFDNKWDIFSKKKATKKDAADGLDRNGQVLKNSITAPFEQAERMIQALATDEGFIDNYQGDKEVIVTGQIDGVNWKGKVDCLNLDKGYFIDLKTTQQLDKKYWNVEEHGWDSFVAHWNYQLQMYVYQQLILQTYGVLCTPYIIAVTKEKIPAKAIISIPEERMLEAEDQIYEMQDHIEDVKAGRVEPTRCGKCDYCKSTAKLGKIVSMDDLID